MSEPPQKPLEAEAEEKVAGQSGEKEDNDEDPLVIDEHEEKAAEVAEAAETDEANQEEDNEKEFEPTVDMLMNEFDDEQTIEEEEALGQDDDDELSALQSEQDMPIEELLKLYGYNNAANGAASQEPESSQQEESKTEEGSEKVEEAEEEPTKEVAQAVPEVEDEEEAESEPDTASNVQKGEKRSSSSPPPAKKARSELAKFYEATVEGRNLRSSAGLVDEEDEESGEEELEEGKDYSWKKTIMIGPSYQAQVPGGLNNYDDNAPPPYENEDKLLWDPTRLSEDTCKEYLAKSGELQGATAALGVNGIPTGSHIRDDEQALLLLLQCGYNSEEALRRRRMNVVPPADTMSLWSEEECKAFETGLRVYGKDFHSIQNQKVGTRSVGELVQFYYLWKKTERHDVFANSFRIEKKKYTLHPGTTDYMERFMDEQDIARDRSVSPNFHSLIYGDSKRRSETKLESIANGAEKSRGAGEGDDGTLAEATIL